MAEAKVTAARLTEAFKQGFDESQGVLDQNTWIYRVGLIWEGVKLNERLFKVEHYVEMLQFVSAHLVNGPGTGVSITCELRETADATAAEAEAHEDQLKAISDGS